MSCILYFISFSDAILARKSSKLNSTTNLMHLWTRLLKKPMHPVWNLIILLHPHRLYHQFLRPDRIATQIPKTSTRPSWVPTYNIVNLKYNNTNQQLCGRPYNRGIRGILLGWVTIFGCRKTRVSSSLSDDWITIRPEWVNR